MKALLIDINGFTKWIDVTIPPPEYIEIGLFKSFDPNGSVVFHTDKDKAPIEACKMVRKIFYRDQCNYTSNYVEYKERL